MQKPLQIMWCNVGQDLPDDSLFRADEKTECKVQAVYGACFLRDHEVMVISHGHRLNGFRSYLENHQLCLGEI